MKRFWLSGICVCAGWFVGAAAAQEGGWRSASPRPLGIARTEGTLLGRPSGISLGRPQPLDETAEPVSRHSGARVVPTAFHTADGPGLRPLARGKLLDDAPASADKSSEKKADLPTAPLPVEQGPPGNTDFLTKMPAPGPATEKATPPLEQAPVATTETLKKLPAASPVPSTNPAAHGQGPTTEKLTKKPSPGPAPGDGAAPNASSPPGMVGPLGSETIFGTGPSEFVTLPGGEIIDGDVITTEPPPGFWGSVTTPQGRFYGSAEYLLWWLKGANTPPLVTTSPASVPQNLQGVLGQPTTSVLFGGSQLTQNPFSGGRFFAGYRFGPCNLWAVEAGGFFLGQQTANFSASSPYPSVIARPFIANMPGGMAENAELVASPGSNPGDLFASAGGVRIDAPTQLWGMQANLRRTICCGCNYNLDLLAGYRYLNLSEGLHITEDLVALRAVPQAGIGVGDRIIVTDNFDTRNQFNGGQLGAIGEWRYGRLILGGSLRVALGDMHQVVNIHGTTQIIPANAAVAPRTFNSGLLALSSNSGTFSRDRFVVVPEVGLRVGYQVTNNIRVFVAYNFLYVSSVVRPGDQIDRVLNTNLIPPGTPNPPPGTPHPVVPFKTTDLWAQGVSFGLEWRY